MEPGLKIKENEFASILEKLNEKVKNVEERLDNINKIMTDIKSDDENWKGKTADRIYAIYSTFYKNFPNITTQLNDYNKFLTNTLEEYKQAEQNIKADIDKNDSNLNIN